jgi:large repetitive protein
MTWKTVFSNRPTKRRRSTPTSSKDLSRCLGVRPRLEFLEDRLAPAQLALTSNLPSPAVYGQQVTIVGSGASANEAAGSIQLLEGGAALTPAANNSAAADASGNFTITYSALSAGTHTLVISDGGTNTNSSSFDQEVSLGTTSATNPTSPQNGQAFGIPVTLTATIASTVAGGTGAPTGSVTFLDGGTSIASGAIGGGGVATAIASTLSVGSHTITTSYGGDLNFSGSNSPGSFTESVVGQASTSTTVTAPAGTPTLLYFGGKVTFTATVANTLANSIATPTGSVSFSIMNGATVAASGSGTLNGSGTATFATSSLSPGTYTATATYAANTNFTGSGPSSAANTTVITAAATQVFVSTGSTTLVFGQPWVATAHVLVKPGFGTGTPGTTTLGANGAGKVTFSAILTTNADASNNFLLGGTFTIPLGSFGVSNSGFASLGVPASGINPAIPGVLPGQITAYNAAGNPVTLSTLTYTISGTFAGTGASPDFANTLPADITTTTRAVGGTAINTVTQLFANPAGPIQAGQKVTFTVVITAAGGSNTFLQPLGTVTFNDTVNGVTTPTIVPLPTLQIRGRTDSVATFSTTALARGAHSLGVVYNPDLASTAPDFTNPANTFATLPAPVRGQQWNTSSLSGFGFVVKQDTTTGTLTAFPSGHSTTHGQTVTFTDTVRAGFGGIVSGLVQFKIDGVTTAAVSLDATGKATFTTNSLSTGAHTVTAVYNAHSNFAGDTSNALTYTAALAALATAPRGQGSVSFTQSTTTSAKSTTPLSTSNLDGYFASPTTPTTRTLAGALAKVHSNDDWLGGSF